MAASLRSPPGGSSASSAASRFAFLPVAGRSAAYLDARPPRGCLLFDAAFESGNLGYVEENEDEYTLQIRGDTRASHHSIWFYFRCTNVKRGQRVLFHICNYSKRRSLFNEGFTPVVRSSSRPAWERLPPKSVQCYRCPRHAPRQCILIAFTFEREWQRQEAGGPEEEYFFAYSFPYTFSDLQRYLGGLDATYGRSGIYRRELLTKTLQGRRLDLLCITSEENMQTRQKDAALIAAIARGQQWLTSVGAASMAASSSAADAADGSSAGSQRKRCIFLTARVHPGETPASFVVAGSIDFLLSNDPTARTIREHCIVFIIPMLNPDGVACGNYRTNSLGFDLNRCWIAPTRSEQPTIAATKLLLIELSKEKRIQLEYFIDIHAHTSALSSFMFCNQSDTPLGQHRSEDLPRLLDAHSDMFSLSSTKVLSAELKDKVGTGRQAMGSFLGQHATLCYTLEASFFCGLKAGKRSPPYTQADYLDMGRTLASTLALAMRIAGRQATIGNGGPAAMGTTTMTTTSIDTTGGSSHNSSRRRVSSSTPASPSLASISLLRSSQRSARTLVKANAIGASASTHSLLGYLGTALAQAPFQSDGISIVAASSSSSSFSTSTASAAGSIGPTIPLSRRPHRRSASTTLSPSPSSPSAPRFSSALGPASFTSSSSSSSVSSSPYFGSSRSLAGFGGGLLGRRDMSHLAAREAGWGRETARVDGIAAAATRSSFVSFGSSVSMTKLASSIGAPIASTGAIAASLAQATNSYAHAYTPLTYGRARLALTTT